MLPLEAIISWNGMIGVLPYCITREISLLPSYLFSQFTVDQGLDRCVNNVLRHCIVSRFLISATGSAKLMKEIRN